MTTPPNPPANPWTAPHPHAGTPTPPPNTGSDPLSTLIPYKNSNALASYYLGLFSILPLVGLVLAVVAFVLGIKELKFAAANPAAKGKGHAWTGIITGTLFGLFNLFLAGLIVAALVGAVNRLE